MGPLKDVKCVITGKPAKYRDPLTGLPYHDLASFKVPFLPLPYPTLPPPPLFHPPPSVSLVPGQEGMIPWIYDPARGNGRGVYLGSSSSWKKILNSSLADMMLQVIREQHSSSAAAGEAQKPDADDKAGHQPPLAAAASCASNSNNKRPRDNDVGMEEDENGEGDSLTLSQEQLESISESAAPPSLILTEPHCGSTAAAATWLI
jgi:hypothetical protein